MLTKTEKRFCVLLIAVCAILVVDMILFSINHLNCKPAVSQMEPIVYTDTALTYMEKNNGNNARIAGYMSLSSPEDGSYAYITATPITPFTNTAVDGKVSDVVVCYPSKGTVFAFNEDCLRVTGTVKWEEVTTSEGVTVPWCLTNCSYEIITPTDKISEYNSFIDCGGMKVIDIWLSGMYTGISTPEEAKTVDASAYEAKLLEVMGGSLTETAKSISDTISTFNVGYNEWVESGHAEEGETYTELEEKYHTMLDAMYTWVNSVKVSGDE